MSETVAPRSLARGLADRRPPHRSDRRGFAVLTASVALHALILAPMAFRLFETEPAEPVVPYDAPIFIDIAPRPLLEGERSRAPAAATMPGAVEETRPLTGPTTLLRAPAIETDDEDDDRPAPPAARVSPGVAGPTSPGSPSRGADAGAWQVRPQGLGARIGRSMRLGAGGCRIMDGRLSAAEQAVCDDAFNAAAGAARSLGPRTSTPGEARRDAQFARDGARALAQYEARRAPLRSGVGVVTSGEGVGGNFGTGAAGAHLDPQFRNGADNLLRQDSNKLGGPRRLPGLTPPPE